MSHELCLFICDFTEDKFVLTEKDIVANYTLSKFKNEDSSSDDSQLDICILYPRQKWKFQNKDPHFNYVLLFSAVTLNFCRLLKLQTM